MSLIKQMRNGKEYDATFGTRMRGEGIFAELLEKRFYAACKRYDLNAAPSPTLDISLFKKVKPENKQFELF